LETTGHRPPESRFPERESDDLDVAMSGGKLAVVVLLALPVGVRSDSSCEKKPPPASTTAATATPGSFASSVRPVLLARCAPCHEPGGRLYAKLPFDRAETIASHPQGVLKRLKGADREAVEKWLASLPPAR
jgi:hypothetical protein